MNFENLLGEIQMEIFKNQTLSFAFKKIRDSTLVNGHKKSAKAMTDLIKLYEDAAKVSKKIYDTHVEVNKTLREERNAAETIKPKVNRSHRHKPKQDMAEHKTSGKGVKNKRNSVVGNDKKSGQKQHTKNVRSSASNSRAASL